MTEAERENRLLRLSHSLDVARQLAERLRLVASRAVDVLASPAADDAEARVALVQAAVDAEGPALAAEGLVRRLQSMVDRLRLEGV